MTDRQIFTSMGFVVLSVFALVFMWEFVIEDLIGPQFLASYEQEPLSHRWEYTLVATVFAAIALIFPTYLLRNLSFQNILAAQAAGTREAQMRLVTDALPALIGYFDTEQRLQFVNKTFESWYEVPRDEIVGRKIRDVMAEYIAEADYERFRPHVETVLSGEEVHFEEVVTYPDGYTRNVSVTYIPEFGSGGSIEGAFAFIQDVTERKRMEDAVRESEARLRAIIDNAPNAISLKDRRGHYLLINRVFEEMLDTTSEEVRGKSPVEVFPREFAESGLAHDRAVVEKRSAIEREEELVLGDHVYTYLTTKFPIRDASGDIVSIGAIHTDITERKRAEDDVRKARDELEVRVEERTSELRAVNAQLLEEITERKRAEAALIESSAQLAEVARIAGIGHSIWDEREDREVYSSEEGDRIWGAQLGELWDFDEFLASVHTDDRARVEAVMERARENRTGYEIDYRIVRPDGEIRFVLERADAVLDDAGEHIETVTTVQDITEHKKSEEALRRAHDELELRVEERTADLRTTNRVLLDEIAERKRTEEALHESKERYREIFEESAVGIWEEDWSAVKRMVDRLARRGVKDWRKYLTRRPNRFSELYELIKITRVSRMSLELYRAPDVTTLVAMDRLDLISEDERMAAFETLLSFIAGEMSREFETEERRYDGTEFTTRIRVVVPPEHRDHWSRVFYSIEDITDRMRAEEALRQSEARLRSIMDHAPAEIFLIDTDGRYILVNKEFERRYNLTEEEVKGRTVHDFFPADIADEFLAQDREVLETAKATMKEQKIEYGDALHTDLQVKFPIVDATGGIVGAGGMAIDITQREQIEDELRQFQTHLAHASRLNMVGEMAAGLAHELNQPLAVISSYAQGCLTNLHNDKFGPDDIDDALQQIVTHSARASEVVRRIRGFISEAKHTVASINVNAAIGVAFDLLLGEARSRDVSIRLDLAEPSPMAMVDEIELQQVVLNLARNGIEAMSRNGSDHRELIIRTANVGLPSNDDEVSIKVSVQDTGPGIPTEIRERIFDPFFTTKAGGLGMGLSICRSIVDRHGGRMWLDADDESSTAFHFTVPAG